MPKSFVRRAYEDWISKNEHRFRFRPWIAESRKSGFTLKFSGLTTRLIFQVRHRRPDGHAELFILDDRGVWDILGDFDVVEVRTPDGRYRCALCEGDDFYPSRAALWEAHVFEPLLEWVNLRTEDQWIGLQGMPGETDFWCADMIGADMIKKRDYVDVFSVVTDTSCKTH